MTRPPSGFRSVGDAVAAITRPIFAERGFVNAQLLTAWPRVVGPELAAACAPAQVKFPQKGGPGVLHVRLTNSAMAPLVQHDEPAIVERINTFFGYRAIERLHLLHVSAPAPAPSGGTRQEPPPTESAADIDDITRQVDDPRLREILRALGGATRPKHPPRDPR